MRLTIINFETNYHLWNFILHLFLDQVYRMKIKMCPIFECSQINSFKSDQKILWWCLFGCENIFTCNYQTTKFHNCHQTIVYAAPCSKAPNSAFLCLRFALQESLFCNGKRLSMEEDGITLFSSWHKLLAVLAADLYSDPPNLCTLK